MNRRDFLKAAAATTGLVLLPNITTSKTEEVIDGFSVQSEFICNPSPSTVLYIRGDSKIQLNEVEVWFDGTSNTAVPVRFYLYRGSELLFDNWIHPLSSCQWWSPLGEEIESNNEDFRAIAKSDSHTKGGVRISGTAIKNNIKTNGSRIAWHTV